MIKKLLKSSTVLEITLNQKRISFSHIKKQYDSRKEFAGGNMELKDQIS